MIVIPAKVKDRLTTGIKKYQPVLVTAKSRDINESDTVTIITDILSDVFGFDKFLEITSEYAIRGTFVDLAIKLGGTLQILIEVKAIGLGLKDSFVKQAIDYAANQGIEWVVLSNGVTWQIYKVSFSKPISFDLILEIDFLSLNPRNPDHLENLYLLTREGIGKSILEKYHAQKQALSRFFIGAVILSNGVLTEIRKELRKISPDVKIDTEQIKNVLVQEVLKRDVLEGEKADEARHKIEKMTKKLTNKKNPPDVRQANNLNESITTIDKANSPTVAQPLNKS